MGANFTSSVRRGDVPQPAQRSFTILTWTEAFEKVENPSAADGRLHASGLFFYEKLSQARQRHGKLPRLGISSSDHIRLLVAAVNLSAKLDQRYTHQTISDHARLRDDNRSFFGPAMQALNSGLASRNVQLVDAIRHVLPEASKHEQDGAQPLPDDRLLEIIGAELELGRLYEALSTGWLECLWADYYVEPYTSSDGVEADILMPSDETRDQVRALGDFRRDSLLMEFGIHAVGDWHRLPSGMRRVLENEPVVKRIVWQKGTAKPVLGRRGSLGFAPPSTFVARTIANEPYFRPLLDEPLPNLSDLTLTHLLNAWAMIASFAEVVEARITQRHIATVADALRWAPLIEIKDAERCLVEGLHITPEQARIAVDIQILPFDARSDPWVRPWVRIGGDHITPLFHAVQNANLVRCMESWLEEGGISLSRRGKLFEQALRTELAEQVELPNTSVFPRAVRVRSDDGDEEIDLVIRVGATLLIGECKCSVYPVGAHGYLMYEQTLSEGVAQAERKAEFCRKYPELLLRAINLESVLRPDEVTVLPVVVTNVPHGAGQVIKGVPISDVYILARYLDGGQNYIRQAMLDRSGVHAGTAVRFYESAEDAPYRLGTYLADPPQLHEARNWLKFDVGEWVPSYLLDRPLLYGDHQVKPEVPAREIVPPDDEHSSTSKSPARKKPPHGRVRHRRRRKGRGG